MMQSFSQSINRRCFHFKISDAVLSELKLSKPVYQMRIRNPKSQNSSLWPIKPGTGNGNSLVKTFYKML